MASDLEIGAAAAKAGWSKKDLPVAIAVALAESGGNTSAHATSGEDSRGAWQINVRAHPELATLDLYNLNVNAQAAYGIWKKSGWGPWSAHNNGSYLLYMGRGAAAAAVTNIGAAVTGGVADAAGAIPGVDQAKVVAGFLSDLQNPAIWQRILKVVIGGALIMVGGFLIVQTQMAAPLASQIKKVVPK